VDKPVSKGRGEAKSPDVVFVSYSSANQKKALSLCRSLEERGTRCWISCRDVTPGSNYQDQIVRAIGDARAMVLVFSKSANSSDEIKKELSLASKSRVPVIAVRIENVQPTHAFAYELSTRQWIDAFPRWEKAMDLVNSSLNSPDVPSSPPSRRFASSRRPLAFAAGMFALLLLVGAWFWLRPHTNPQHDLQVRLAGFQSLSPGLPATIPDTIREELINAFGEDSIVRLSTAAAPPPGEDPAYALSGTARLDGAAVKIIFRLNNERTGTTLWTYNSEIPATQLDKMPRRVAIETSMIVRCGLFGASTYPGTLPEATVSDYLQYCANAGDEPDKALDFARKVVAAAPNFSWGWSAIEIADFNALLNRPPPADATRYRTEGLAAADKAIALDSTNSEAYAFKSHLIPQGDLVARENLLRQALNSRTLPCGCEHHFYGDFLNEVGRLNDAVVEYKRSVDIMALNADSQLSLADLYYRLNRPDLAKAPLAAAKELSVDPDAAAKIAIGLAPITGDYADALKYVHDPQHGPPPVTRRAISAAYAALTTKDPVAMARALAVVKGMPSSAHGPMYVTLLGALGASSDALNGVVDAAADSQRAGTRSWLWTPALRGALRQPNFPAVADKLGLMSYWRSTHTRPDVCNGSDAPLFCKSI
jgi:tetratricopeptide (TPR) repeat protein